MNETQITTQVVVALIAAGKIVTAEAAAKAFETVLATVRKAMS